MIFQPNLVLHIKEALPENISFYEHELASVTHFLGPIRHTLTSSATSCIFFAHYPKEGEPFTGPVTKLTFAQLGNSVPPPLGEYAQTCEIVEFTGYINEPSTIFHVLDQLPKVSTVDIFVGPAKQYTWMHQQGIKCFSRTPLCPWVKSVSIGMDLEYFEDSHHDCTGDAQRCSLYEKCPVKIQNHLVLFVQYFLQYARDSFPNLECLLVKLPPQNRTLRSALQTLINVSPNIRERIEQILQNSRVPEVKAKFSVLDYANRHSEIPAWCIPNINRESNDVLPPRPLESLSDSCSELDSSQESDAPDFQLRIPEPFPEALLRD